MYTSPRSSNSVSVFWSLVIVVLLCSLTSQITNPLMPEYCSSAASESWAALHSNQQGEVLWSPVREASSLSNFEALLPLLLLCVRQRLYGVKPSQRFSFCRCFEFRYYSTYKKTSIAMFIPTIWVVRLYRNDTFEPLDFNTRGNMQAKRRKTNKYTVGLGGCQKDMLRVL